MIYFVYIAQTDWNWKYMLSMYVKFVDGSRELTMLIFKCHLDAVRLGTL